MNIMAEEDKVTEIKKYCQETMMELAKYWYMQSPVPHSSNYVELTEIHEKMSKYC